MFLRARNSRSLTVLAVVACLTLPAAAGCGADLGKANFPRSTAPAAPAGSSAPVDTKAYDLAVLQLLDPCSLIDKTALAVLGAPGDPSPSSTLFGQCRNSAKDAGGKEIKVSVEVGRSLSASSTKASGTVDGLPQIVDKTDDTLCTVGAVTTNLKSKTVGIAIEVTYNGGDACKAGRTLLPVALKKIREAPVKFPDAKGTLLTLDPCETVDAAAVSSLAPSPTVTRLSLYSCQWDGGPASVIEIFKKGLDPIEGDGYSKVDLGGVTGFQKPGIASGSQCTVQWKQRAWQDDDVEIAQVEYANRDANKDTDDACGKAVKVAKTVVGKLPKA